MLTRTCLEKLMVSQAVQGILFRERKIGFLVAKVPIRPNTEPLESCP
jgi:hypothetical protein